MKKTILSLLAGSVIGIIDVIPMIIQKLPWYECISAFMLWIVASFLILNTNIKVKGFLKGIIISFAIAVPVLILISNQGINIVLMVGVTTIVLGCILGFVIDKIKVKIA